MSFAIKLPVLSVCVLFAASLTAKEYIIEAPDGVGDVVALTNAFKKSHYASTAVKILLKPGVYDLSGIKMDGSRHLLCYALKATSVIAGLGTNPGDTVLLGGGATDNCRIMDLYGGDVTVSNLTVTGGYLSGNSDGAGINGGPNVCYRHLIVSNNYAKGSGGGGAGGCMKGSAYNCIFVDNRTGKYGAALYVDSNECGAWDCVFSNNVAASHILRMSVLRIEERPIGVQLRAVCRYESAQSLLVAPLRPMRSYKRIALYRLDEERGPFFIEHFFPVLPHIEIETVGIARI